MRIHCAFALGALVLGTASGLSGCGDNREERGLIPSGTDAAAPFDPAVASETEAERDRESLEDEQQAEKKRFEEAQK